MANPYATARETPEAGAITRSDAVLAHDYAAPDISEGAPYLREFGYSPSLRLSPTGEPDATRLGTERRRDSVPYGDNAPQAFYRRTDEDDRKRHSTEYQDADGWQENKTGFGFPNALRGFLRFAPNPRSMPPPESGQAGGTRTVHSGDVESRGTMRMSPATYSFTRPMDHRTYGDIDVWTSRQNNGMHFSMADHRRNYEILGMRPPQSRRNTYRIDPPPWDADIVDLPPDNAMPTVVPGAVVGVEVNYTSRSWRL